MLAEPLVMALFGLSLLGAAHVLRDISVRQIAVPHISLRSLLPFRRRVRRDPALHV